MINTRLFIAILVAIGVLYWSFVIFAQPIFDAIYPALAGMVFPLIAWVMVQYSIGTFRVLREPKGVDYGGQLTVGVSMTHIALVMVLVSPILGVFGVPVQFRRALVGNAIVLAGVGAVLHLTAVDLKRYYFLHQNRVVAAVIVGVSLFLAGVLIYGQLSGLF